MAHNSGYGPDAAVRIGQPDAVRRSAAGRPAKPHRRVPPIRASPHDQQPRRLRHRPSPVLARSVALLAAARTALNRSNSPSRSQQRQQDAGGSLEDLAREISGTLSRMDDARQED
jgi:hypothetical protein